MDGVWPEPATWLMALTGCRPASRSSAPCGVAFLVSACLVCLADVLRIKGEFAEAKAALDSSLGMIRAV